MMAKDSTCFIGSLSSCASFPTFPIPFAILPSLFIPISNLEGIPFPSCATLQLNYKYTL